MDLLLFFALLFLVITVHETGHFVAAKLCGLPVVSFSVGLGRSIITKRLGGTLYMLRILPLGGIVRGYRHVEDEQDERQADSKRDLLTRLLMPVEEEEFQLVEELKRDPPKAAHPLASAFVLISGCLANLLFSIGLLTVVFNYNSGFHQAYEDTGINWIEPESEAEKAGIQIGDMPTKLNGEPVTSWNSLNKALLKIRTSSVTVEFRRQKVDGSSETFEKTLNYNKTKTCPNCLIPYTCGLGFMPRQRGLSLPLWQALEASLRTHQNSLLSLVHPRLGYKPSAVPEPPIGMVSSIKKVGNGLIHGPQEAVKSFVILTLLVVFLNLIPIPPCDGAMLLYLVVEQFTGSKLSSAFKARLTAYSFRVCIALIALQFLRNALSVF